MKLETILCPIDFTPISARELELAARLCGQLGASLVLQHNLATGAGLGVSWMHDKEHWAEARDQASTSSMSSPYLRVSAVRAARRSETVASRAGSDSRPEA